MNLFGARTEVSHLMAETASFPLAVEDKVAPCEALPPTDIRIVREIFNILIV